MTCVQAFSLEAYKTALHRLDEKDQQLADKELKLTHMQEEVGLCISHENIAMLMTNYHRNHSSDSKGIYC